MHIWVLRFAALVVPMLLLGIAAAAEHTADEIEKLRQRGDQLFNERKYIEALATQRTVAASTEKLETARDGAPGKQTTEELTRVSWYALFARAPAEALKASERAHKLNPATLEPDTNRAHALLFLGRAREAQKLYLLHKGKQFSPGSDKTWEDTIAEDFGAMRAAGIVHKAFPSIVAQLGIPYPELTAEVETTRGKVSRLYDAGKYQEAEAAAETLVASARKRYGAERTEFAGALAWLAHTYQAQGRTAEAEPLYKRSLAIRETALGPDHLDVGSALNNLAELYGSQGRYAEAEPLYRRSLAIRETALGSDHPSVGQSLHNLAQLYESQGRYADAEPLSKRSLAIGEKALGPDHPNVGSALNNLAGLYHSQGRFADAEPLYKRSVAIYEKALGTEHPNVGSALNNLAELYWAQGRYADAEPLYKRTVSIFEKALGPDHPSVATSLNNLAGLYNSQGRYADAEPLFKRSLVISEKALGPDHPSVGTSLNNLAELFRAQGRYADAEPLYKRSVTTYEKALGPDHRSVGTSLNNLAELYESQGRYADAEPLFKRSLAITEKALGPEHPDVGSSLNLLAGLYRAQGRYADAEALSKRSLTIREKALGPDHPAVGSSLNNLAELYRTQGRYAEAEPLYKGSLAIREKALGPDHSDVGHSLSSLAGLYRAQGRYTEAEPLYKRTVSIFEKALGPDHPNVGSALNNLATLYQDQGRYAEAEPLFKRGLAIHEKARGPDHPSVGTSLNNLAELYRGQGRYAEAEPLYKRTISIFEKALGPDHPNVGTLLNNLATLYNHQGRTAEAESLYKRDLAIRETAFGPDNLSVATSLNNLAELYRAQGRYTEAEPLYKRTVSTLEKALGPDHPNVGSTLNNLALLYGSQGRYAEAEPLYKRDLAIHEKALGPEHPHVGQSLNNLAALYRAQGRYAEAEPLFKRSLAVLEKARGPEHPDVGQSLNNLAGLYFAQRDWARAADFWRRSTSVVASRAQRGSDDVGQVLTGKRKGEEEQASDRFSGLVKAAHQLAAQDSGGQGNLAREMFQAAQWAQASEAAASLAQMATRGAKGDPTLAALVRERQDLVGEWQRRDGVRSTAVAQPPDKRDRPTEVANVARLAAIDARIVEIDKKLQEMFPDYTAFARPTPLSVQDVQAELRQDEALVLFLDTPERMHTPEETFIWVVTKSDLRWVRSELGTPALVREVAALRCGLDHTTWLDDGVQRCADLLGIAVDQVPRNKDPLPFDHTRAHKLYQALFGEVTDLIKGKDLLIVPSGALTQLPLHVLVTAPPTTNDHRAATWLARHHALTVLPAVSSLGVLRRVARASRASKSMIGFGNPLLDGYQDDPRYGAYYKKQAAVARAQTGCAERGTERTASLRGLRRSPAPLARASGGVDVAQVRLQTPLPETADELCAVARDLKADVGDIRLGARATEREIKALSDGGTLAQYRIIHFATHGTLAGQLSGTTEPGLILTPPDVASAEDDGYLSASEIAALKLDAEWVILSACNTAAAGATGTGALSGLARAFFYAQARALLVSHWEVYSEATVKLIGSSVAETVRDPTVGRAEALRRAMLAMIDKGAPHEAHPAYWSPFVVVGEGAAVR